MGEKREKKQQNTPVLSATPPQPARAPKESQGEERGRRGKLHHLTSQPAKQLSASANYQQATGWPTLQKGQVLGKFKAMLEASWLIPPHFSMCVSPRGHHPSTAPEPFLSRTENIPLASDSTRRVSCASHPYLGSFKVAQFPPLPITPLLTEIDQHL